MLENRFVNHNEKFAMSPAFWQIEKVRHPTEALFVSHIYQQQPHHGPHEGVLCIFAAELRGQSALKLAQ